MELWDIPQACIELQDISVIMLSTSLEKQKQKFESCNSIGLSQPFELDSLMDIMKGL